jgi:hypothetical protein
MLASMAGLNPAIRASGFQPVPAVRKRAPDCAIRHPNDAAMVGEALMRSSSLLATIWRHLLRRDVWWIDHQHLD